MAAWKDGWQQTRLRRREEKAAENRESLFTLLDENYARYIADYKWHKDGSDFWEGLQKLDAELEPDGIRTEAHSGESEEFIHGERTLVLRMKSEEATRRAARILNKTFAGSAIKCVVESFHENGRDIFQIRSNIDKAHWDKLCVFCHYRFAREIEDPKKNAAYHAQGQRDVSAYTAGTSHAHWKTLEGVPAFITLMGLPGVLRPEVETKPDAEQLQAEFNQAHARGTPYVFENVPIQVELKSSDSSTPYMYGFNPTREAWRLASGGKNPGSFFLESMGGNPFPRNQPLSLRIMYALALTSTITSGVVSNVHALLQHGHHTLSVIGPVTVLASAAVVGVGHTGYQYAKIKSHMKQIKRDFADRVQVMRQRSGPEAALRAQEAAEEANLFEEAVAHEMLAESVPHCARAAFGPPHTSWQSRHENRQRSSTPQQSL